MYISIGEFRDFSVYGYYGYYTMSSGIVSHTQ